MKELSGLSPELIKTYPIEIELDQNYEIEAGSFEYGDIGINAEIGLVSQMVIDHKVDPYSGKKIKPKRDVIRTTC
jgi:hypothetical protein